MTATAARRSIDAATWLLVGLLVGAGAILAAILVGELVAPIATDPHHDFLAFFAAGRLVLTGQAASLYDASAITSVQRTVIPGPIGANGYMPFINPPFAAVAFAPLATLSAQAARAALVVLSAAMLVVAAAWIARPLATRERIAAGLLVALSFPAYHSLAEGQWSAAMLLGGVAALQAARRGSWRLAGLALATWWLKPQLIVLPLLALALHRRWTAVAWTLLGGAALAVVSLPFVPVGTWGAYASYLVEVGVSHFNGAGAVAQSVWQGNLAGSEGLNGLLIGLFGQASVVSVNVLWAILVAGLLSLWLLACRSHRPGFAMPAGRRLIAAGIGIVLLVNPNLFLQDCVLVFLLGAALQPTPPHPTGLAATELQPTELRDYWRVIVGLAVIAAATALSSQAFTLALLAVVVVWCLQTVAGQAPKESRVASPSRS